MTQLDKAIKLLESVNYSQFMSQKIIQENNKKVHEAYEILFNLKEKTNENR